MRIHGLDGGQRRRHGWIRSSQLRSRSFAASGVAAMVAFSVADAAAQDVRSVKARYDVSFAGVSVGDFTVDSEIDGRRYTISSATNVKLLLGAFNWTSQSVTHGVVGKGVAPEAFELKYRSNRKKARTAVRFVRGDVASVDSHPPAKPSRKRVPLKPEHLKGVMDPMTAIMVMTRGAKRNPCEGSFDVFEGRVRFKLSLEAKGKRPIAERGNSGQPRVGYLCRIRFTPIAGHKRDKTVEQMARNNDIEVVLRPVPKADLFVPYQITVPTGYGTVAITSRQVEIIGERRERIALSH